LDIKKQGCQPVVIESLIINMAESTKSTKTSFSGSCHCQAVKYNVLLSIPDPPTATRCNCTFCQKTGWTTINVEKPSDLTLISPASIDEMQLYQGKNKDIERRICGNCGVYIVAKGSYEYEGKKVDFFTINLMTLDQPQEGLDLSKFKMSYYDGLTNNWEGGQKENEPWSGGTI
jgi:hypothetical protein